MQEILVNVLLAAVALLAAGLLVWARGKGAALRRSQRVMLARILASSLFLLLLQVLGPDFFSSFGPAGRYVRLACYMLDYLLIGYDILREAARNIRNGQVLDENFLMAIATVGAFALAVHSDGDYLEAIAVMLFYQVGEWFQSYAVGKSRKNISELMDIRPDYANIERGGKIERVDPGEVAPGSVIVVMPGEKVPLDGVVAEGSTTLDTAALTGESVPRDVAPGDEIVSGCVNMTGLVKIRTTKAFGESTVSKILDLVENASSRKSRSEAFISRFAKVYTPAVCGAALLLAVVPPVVNLVLGNPSQFGTWLYRALTFLVASCPCALVISIPLTFFAGLGGASKEGILVKGSNYLEALSKTTTVVFDKTGTLTKGAFSVTGVHHNSMPEEKLLELAAHAESSSSHPIGKCIVSAWGGLVDRTRVRDVAETGGNGVVATVDGMKVACGNDKLMARLGVERAPRGSEGTVVHVAVDGAYAGQIVVDDTLKPNSAKAIQALKAAGVTETVMLTGDGEAAAARVAGDLGISRHYSNLLPGDKVAKVEELLASKKKGTLAFVGDGINDAPVLSRADIGIAMGALGSDAAIEASDVVLMDDDPLKIAKAIRISRKCLGIVYQNIVFAIGVKLACLVLVAVGLAGMWLAVFADVGVMVLAVLNAIRALFVKNL